MNTALISNRSSLIQELALTVREQRYLIGIIAAYSVIAFIVFNQIGIHWNLLDVIKNFGSIMLLGPVFALCGYCIYVMIFVRPDQLTQYLISSLRQYLTRARLLNSLPLQLLIPLFANSFSILKSAIPYYQPYAWDSRLAHWDKVLHGGTHPWILLQETLGHPLLTSVINVVYHLWFFIVFALLYWLTLDVDNLKLRQQFLLSFVITWILLGTVAATLFSSAGPCYYGFLQQGENPYAHLMTYLQVANTQYPIWALDVQEMLWNAYMDKSKVAELGISAFPSLHVATSVLLAMFGWRVSRNSGIALSIFALVIMIGSVHLGWHYAIDGYVGAAGAYAIWRVVGWALSRSSNVSTIEASFAKPQVPYTT